MAETDRVVARLAYGGTNGGRSSASPTGRPVSYAGMALVRIADGRIATGVVIGDTGRLLREIGG